MGMCCEKMMMTGCRNVWSMKFRVEDQEEDQRVPGERLSARIAKQVSWTKRSVSVSSGTGLPGLSRTKTVKLLITVYNCNKQQSSEWLSSTVQMLSFQQTINFKPSQLSLPFGISAWPETNFHTYTVHNNSLSLYRSSVHHVCKMTVNTTVCICNSLYLSEIVVISSSGQVQSSLLRGRHAGKQAVEYVIVSLVAILVTASIIHNYYKNNRYISWLTLICFYRSIIKRNYTTYKLLWKCIQLYAISD